MIRVEEKDSRNLLRTGLGIGFQKRFYGSYYKYVERIKDICNKEEFF